MKDVIKATLSNIQPGKRWGSSSYQAKPGSAVDDALRVLLNEAIKVDRERIMKIFYDTMHEEFHPDYRDLLCEDFKKYIFGEEK